MLDKTRRVPRATPRTNQRRASHRRHGGCLRFSFASARVFLRANSGQAVSPSRMAGLSADQPEPTGGPTPLRHGDCDSRPGILAEILHATRRAMARIGADGARLAAVGRSGGFAAPAAFGTPVLKRRCAGRCASPCRSAALTSLARQRAATRGVRPTSLSLGEAIVAVASGAGFHP
jgi:hypothetical protein